MLVPSELGTYALNKIHEGHFGIEKTKNRAREILFWPAMSTQIEQLVSNCNICEKFSRKNCKEPLKSFPVPDRPWERVGTDIFSYGNTSFLVLNDAYSNWLEVVSIKDKSSQEVIRKLKSIFSKFGSPDVLV